jgi:hypothetical protein
MVPHTLRHGQDDARSKRPATCRHNRPMQSQPPPAFPGSHEEGKHMSARLSIALEIAMNRVISDAGETARRPRGPRSARPRRSWPSRR